MSQAIEPNIKDGVFGFPREMKVLRQYFAKSDNHDGSTTVHSVTVFPTDALKVQPLFGNRDLP